MEIPATRDLFFPRQRTRFGSAGWVLGEDLGADIVLLDMGRVEAVSNDRVALVNNSLDQYVESPRLVGGLRDHLIDYPDDEESIVECDIALRNVDEAAYAQGEYWSLIMEQIRDEQF
jgi:hypothetical protein